MKYIIIKVFYDNPSFGIRVMMGNIKDNQKYIDKDVFKTFSNFDKLKNYLSNLSFNINYLKTKLFIDFIISDVLIETITKENDANKNIYIKEKVIDLYPNYLSKYNIFQEENIKNVKFKSYYLTLIPKNINEIIEEINGLFVTQKKVYGIDCLLFQQYLNKNIHYFYKKNLFLIQIDCIYWRFYKILNGKISDYLVLNEEYKDFQLIKNEIFKEINQEFDEVIIDSDYRSYVSISEDIKHQNISYIDCANKLQNIDERKMTYAKECI